MTSKFTSKVKALVNQYKHGLMNEEQFIEALTNAHEHDKSNLEQVALLRKEMIDRLKKQKAS
jgi:hypothetical protein